MIHILVIAAVLAAPPDARATGPSPADLGAYKQARASVGRDADSHVRLALWCEARGLDAERTKHLTIATLIDPNHAAARGLLGMVQYQGKWLSPDAVAERIQADPVQQARIREYLQRRVKAADEPGDQMKLAAWCDQNELKDQAAAHYYRAVQLDPGRESAWKHLGYKKEKGRWVKPEQLAAEKEFAELQEKADRRWKPALEKLRNRLSSHSAAERSKAQAALDEISDPAAVPMIWATFAQGNAKHQEVAVRLFGRIDAPRASKALAILAVSGRSADVRREAVVILKQRDPRDFVEVLTAMIRKPIEYEVRRKAGVNSPGELFVKGADRNFRRIYTMISAPTYIPNPWDAYGFDANGLPVVSRFLGGSTELLAAGFPVSSSSGPLDRDDSARVRAYAQAAVGSRLTGAAPGWASIEAAPQASAERLTSMFEQAGASPTLAGSVAKNLAESGLVPTAALAPVPFGRIYGTFEHRLNIPLGQMILDGRRSAQEAEWKLAGDVQRIEAYNAPIHDLNRKARRVLSDTVGADLGDDPQAWDRWTTDLFGRHTPVLGVTREIPTTTEEVAPSYIPQAVPTLSTQMTNVAFVRRMSCFAGGTLVRTIDGPRPIEDLRPGDLVLTQGASTGRVAFKPVVGVFHNPPKETLKISLEGTDETIVPTEIHRFWKVGRGWVMARDLKPGDSLRTLGGSVAVRSVDSDTTQPVFNLRIADVADYFVGGPGVLAHDNSLPTPVADPFDRAGAPELAAADRK